MVELVGGGDSIRVGVDLGGGLWPLGVDEGLLENAAHALDGSHVDGYPVFYSRLE